MEMNGSRNQLNKRGREGRLFLGTGVFANSCWPPIVKVFVFVVVLRLLLVK